MVVEGCGETSSVAAEECTYNLGKSNLGSIEEHQRPSSISCFLVRELSALRCSKINGKRALRCITLESFLTYSYQLLAPDIVTFFFLWRDHQT